MWTFDDRHKLLSPMNLRSAFQSLTGPVVCACCYHLVLKITTCVSWPRLGRRFTSFFTAFLCRYFQQTTGNRQRWRTCWCWETCSYKSINFAPCDRHNQLGRKRGWWTKKGVVIKICELSCDVFINLHLPYLPGAFANSPGVIFKHWLHIFCFFRRGSKSVVTKKWSVS